MMHAANLDPRIGMLNSGKFYAFVNGYDKPETVGSLEQVEAALGLRATPTPKPTEKTLVWDVKLTFQYPAWDETDGIDYSNIVAKNKSDANAIARRKASRDGHLHGGKGRVVFTATESK